MVSSASIDSTQSPVAASRARCFWAPKPIQSVRMRTRHPCASAIATVASVDPLSTTTISSQNASEARQAGRSRASFLVMMVADSLVAVLPECMSSIPVAVQSCVGIPESGSAGDCVVELFPRSQSSRSMAVPRALDCRILRLKHLSCARIEFSIETKRSL